MPKPVMKWVLIGALFSVFIGAADFAISLGPVAEAPRPKVFEAQDPAPQATSVSIFLNYPDEEMRVRVNVVTGSEQHKLVTKCRESSGDNMFAFMECGNKHGLTMLQERIEVPYDPEK